MILKARADCQQNQISVHSPEMDFFLSAWEETLEEIPSRYLKQCYLMAIRKHDTSFPLSSGEIASVWEQNGREWLKAEKEKQESEAAYCERCTGTQWEILKGNDGRSGARPCPDCNYDRLAKWS